MKTVTYKGYQASVEYEDETLFVKVLHISDLLIAECDKASEVEVVARELIDDYLQTCKEVGRDPEPPFKGSFNVRMGPELHRKAAMAAAEAGGSLNAWVVDAVTEKLDCGRLSDRFDGVIYQKRMEWVGVLDAAQRHRETATGGELFSRAAIQYQTDNVEVAAFRQKTLVRAQKSKVH